MKKMVTIYIDGEVKKKAMEKAHEQKPKSSLSREVERLLRGWLKEKDEKR